jgi:MerR family transcriptional regulator, light-induced transcriptional regulator
LGTAPRLSAAPAAAQCHRRYSERQLELVRRVAAARAAGLSLAAAIERASRQVDSGAASLFAALRRRRPELEPRTILKRTLVALSRAIEDESLSRAERPVLFGCFQRERFYRQAQARWRELSHGAALAVVFADFKRARSPRAAPVEIPLEETHPLQREWAIVCDADGYAVCLGGREPPSSSSHTPAPRRAFETIWSVEPNVVREAARICAELAAGAQPALARAICERLDAEPVARIRGQLRLASAITNRTFSYLA